MTAVPWTSSAAGRRPLVVIGGTGFVGRHLMQALSTDGTWRATFAVHRQTPDWLPDGAPRVGADAHAGRHTAAHTFDLQDVCSLQRLLTPGAAVINLLRPDGGGWFEPAIANILTVCEKSRVSRYVHVSSIDVYGANAANELTSRAPTAPVTPYQHEHRLAEEMALGHAGGFDVAVVRCGAIFGDGGLNVVSLAREAARAPWLKLALRRMLYGGRRMHLVSVRRVTEVLLAAAADTTVLRPRDLLLLTDDDAPENNFAYVQDRLLALFNRPAVDRLPTLPPRALAQLLRWRGQSRSNPCCRLIDPRPARLRPSDTCFVAELAHYLTQLQSDL